MTNWRDRGRYIAVFILLFFISGLLIALSEYQDQEGMKRKQSKNHAQIPPISEDSNLVKTENTFVGIFFGTYSPREERYDQIYPGMGYAYGLGLSRRVLHSNQHHLHLFLGVRSHAKEGQSKITKKKTKLYIKPVSLGATYMYVTKIMIPFAEIGIDHIFYNEESSVHSTSGATRGYYLGGGMYFPLPWMKSLKINLYMKYSRGFTFENNLKVNLGGLEYGAGIYYGFNLF